MFDKAKKMWEMQAKAKAVQKELREMQFFGEELGGRIKVVVNGEQKVESIEIDEELFTPSEKESVERFLKQAMTSAVSKSQQTAANKMKEVAKDLGIGL
jgi:DNA-binding YbaB/EbfC family protein